MLILEDNQGAIAIAQNPVQHDRTKHIDIKFHFVRENIERGVIDVKYCETENMLADILTKGLSGPVHEKFCKLLGLAHDTKRSIRS